MGGGEIKDNCIICPFHGWKYDENGECVEIPYNDGKIPSKAKIKAWESKEMNGQVYIWYHIDNEEPSWIPPNYNINSMIYHGYTSQEISCHIQEIPENGADIIHLNVVHTKGVILPKLFTHKWKGTWEPCINEHSHKTNIIVDEELYLFGKFYIPGSHLITEINQYGPSLVNMHFKLPFGMEATVFQTVLPLSPFLQRVQHIAFAKKWVPRFLIKILLYGLYTQVDLDIPIWNNKLFVDPPLQVKNDGNLSGFRRWYSKFYSKNSLSLKDVQKKSLNW